MTLGSVLAVADSDSYVKWAAATLDRLGSIPRRELVVLRTPVRPDDAQTTAAVAGTAWDGRVVDDHSLLGLAARLRRTRPDVVLVATTGPAAEALVRVIAGLPYRPVVVSGLPGMSIPATERALRFRAGVDVFVVHSRRERDAFALAARAAGVDPVLAVNRLAFLSSAADTPADEAPLARVVFAPQAKFPTSPDERRAVLRSLAALARARPDLEVVVKLRAVAGQVQTHEEPYPYDVLWRGLRDDAPVTLVTGPLAAHLTPGTALVTVSSTALLEALAAGLRGLVLADFGVGDDNLTTVYEGSGLLGTLRDLGAGRFFAPTPQWRAENYFHPEPDELPGVLASLGTLPPVRPGPPVGGRRAQARRYARLALPGLALRGARRRSRSQGGH
ncbi:DUF6716 putative glycosyltransferase [Cellulomonas rhizosphaerae]|uniref:D-inositol 3-phosphate glycosyltransferase n=1 Tax=Cellulomonas rhizosphaerae TaxID=2293719 RepID=A0A413RM69_9CELL|nr:DUF6716 putative glycosyltransferase [Cellulomonas rhizosphaerae]RHA41583.1 hypothetical protein D1825_08600 [Cellulomonas rhizosphaerae]